LAPSLIYRGRTRWWPAAGFGIKVADPSLGLQFLMMLIELGPCSCKGRSES